MRARFSRHSLVTFVIGLLSISGAWGTSSVQPRTLQHERLKITNDFAKPEEVVGYYCARDASGFVWSGMLDVERRAFTNWAESPQQDTFFIASKYEVRAAEKIGHQKDQVTVEVKYEITAIGDGNGTKMPPPDKSKEHYVTFTLHRVGSTWKIFKPSPSEISPVVLDSKFPTQGASVASN